MSARRIPPCRRWITAEDRTQSLMADIGLSLKDAAVHLIVRLPTIPKATVSLEKKDILLIYPTQSLILQ